MTANMQPQRPRTQPATSSRHRGHRQQADRALLKDPSYLYIAAADSVVYVSDALNQPLIGELLIEDLWWRSGNTAWRADRPPWFRRDARRSWRERGVLLNDKRSRIVELAAEQGIAPLASRPSGPRHWWQRHRSGG